ncbi:DUF6286 domain-containing protein [Corynebacterium sp.]|uniref:DUF6286 domain-containing protein n=1 Tax=Corynebacterium sp. TaxID=1720 RepID=UPI002A918153|nr:DUF6286 domain-containing protein [Corynebacterium sp.]MDY5786334.1 DUF6286 domain-containing protein [Corynebacterium sp.]
MTHSTSHPVTANRATFPGVGPGAEPRGVASVRWLSLALGAALLGLAVALGRDLWMHYRVGRDTSWTASALRWVADHQIGMVTVAAGVVVSLLGILLLIAAVAPRPRTHVRYSSESSIWMRPVDIARKATFVAREESGAEHVRSQASRKRVLVQLHMPAGTKGDFARTRVEEALTGQFAGLHRVPRIDVELTPAPQTPKEI